LHVVAPLLLGSLIYLAFRSDSLIVFDWLNSLNVVDQTQDFRQLFRQYDLPDWALYSLPDGLWCWASTGWLWIIWRRINLWTASPLILALSLEFGQLFQLIPGVFDWLDCISYITGALIPPLTLKSHNSIIG